MQITHLLSERALGLIGGSVGTKGMEPTALERAKAAELPLPEALFAPLCWLEQKRADFYRRYAEPVLARARGGQEQCA